MPLILLHGDNNIELDDALRAIQDRFEPSEIVSFDGATTSLATISDATRTAGLFDPERLVLIHDLHNRFKGTRKDAAGEEVTRLLDDIAPTTTMVLLSRENLANHPIAQSVRAAGGTIEQHNLPRRGDLPRWITARSARHRATIEGSAAAMLADLVGADPVLLDSELEKLAVYAGPGAIITPSMVDALVGAISQESVFALVDAVAAGDRAAALRLLHAQLGAASSTPIDVALYLIRMLARQMRILLRIRLAQAGGRSRGQIVADLSLNRYYADRYFVQARRLPVPRLSASFESLAALEHGLKSGTAQAEAGLDLLVAELCA